MSTDCWRALTKPFTRLGASRTNAMRYSTSALQRRLRIRTRTITAQHVGHTKRPVLRQKEDGHRCRALQTGQGPHQGQRQTARPRGAANSEVQGVRAGAHSWAGQVLYVSTFSGEFG